MDKLHSPEWNTVKPRPLPATPKEYWIRWYYGKPDIPRDVDPPNFKVFDYYPDGTNGDWSATGSVERRRVRAQATGHPGDGRLRQRGVVPLHETQYMYPYGVSLAYIYPDIGHGAGSLNAFVWERYEIWKQNWSQGRRCVRCRHRARLERHPPETVSEGQGYGIAMSAAIGDKELFDKLWNFVRHYRSNEQVLRPDGLDVEQHRRLPVAP